MSERYLIIEEIKVAPDAPGCFEAFAGRPHSFFLDSGMDHEKLGRYSFMGSDPFLVMKSRGDEVTLVREGKTEFKKSNPFDVLGELLRQYKLDKGETDIPFTGGVVGYFSYDLCHFIEKLPKTAVDDLQLPELLGHPLAQFCQFIYGLLLGLVFVFWMLFIRHLVYLLKRHSGFAFS